MGWKPEPAYGAVRQPGADTRDSCRVRLSGAAGRARGVGRRADRATGAASTASTLGQVPSAHHRLYHRQHVVEDA